MTRENPATDGHDHRTMPADKSLKGSVLALIEEAIEKLPVGHAAGVFGHEGAAKAPNKQAQLVLTHACCSSENTI
jgi:hypothetical protein